jgi:DNA adenine methylase
MLQPILKYPGAKWRLAKWILEQMPPHQVYLEPYFGSGAVFFNKPPVGIETINDIDGDVVNLFKVIREKPAELARLIEFTPWARDEYYESYHRTGDNLEDARRFLVRCWQAYATKIGYRTGWRHSAQGLCPNMPEQWAKIPSRVMEVAERLKHAQIENMDAVDIIRKYNHESVLIYADPPYMLGTRSGRIYAHEMTESDHVRLLESLLRHKGSVILSDYDNPLYNNMLQGWKKASRRAVVEAGQSKVEVIWMNFDVCHHSSDQQTNT